MARLHLLGEDEPGKHSNGVIRVYSEEDYDFLREQFSRPIEEIEKDVLTIIKACPFSTEAEIAAILGRRPLYIGRAVTNLTYKEAALAETDAGELFLLTEENIEIIDRRSDP